MSETKILQAEPINEALAEVARRQKAAEENKDERGAQLLGNIHTLLMTAVEVAGRSPEPMDPRLEAAREGKTVWAIYKRNERKRKRKAA